VQSFKAEFDRRRVAIVVVSFTEPSKLMHIKNFITGRSHFLLIPSAPRIELSP